MGLVFNTDEFDDDDKKGFEKNRGKMITAIQRGSLVINDDCEAVYTPWRPKSKEKEPITFGERSGSSVLASDRKKKDHDAAKGYAVMAEMCGVTASVFGGLVGPDIATCEAIFILLMA